MLTLLQLCWACHTFRQTSRYFPRLTIRAARSRLGGSSHEQVVRHTARQALCTVDCGAYQLACVEHQEERQMTAACPEQSVSCCQRRPQSSYIHPVNLIASDYAECQPVMASTLSQRLSEGRCELFRQLLTGMLSRSTVKRIALASLSHVHSSPGSEENRAVSVASGRMRDL